MSNETFNDAGTEEELNDGLSDGQGDFESARAPAGNSRMMIFGVVIAVGMIAVYFSYFRKGPATAAASSETAAAKATIDEFLQDGSKSLAIMDEMRRNTEQVVQRFLDYPSTTQVPLSDLQSNPFRVVEAEVDAGAMSEAARKRAATERRELALSGVRNLQLQSIMYGDSNRSCMINNAIQQEGGRIDNFTVEKITADSVVVATGTYRFELRLRRTDGALRH